MSVFLFNFRENNNFTKKVYTVKIGGRYEKDSCSIIYEYDATCDIIECKCL